MKTDDNQWLSIESSSDLLQAQLLLMNKKMDLILAALEIELVSEKKKRKYIHRWLRGLKKIRKTDDMLFSEQSMQKDLLYRDEQLESLHLKGEGHNLL
jgi:hypothetical protein